MNTRVFASALLVAALSGTPLLRAQDTGASSDSSAPAAAPAPAAHSGKAPKTALAKDMDKISKAFRALRKQISDSTKNDSSLALLATIHDAATAAGQETPAWTADQPEADRAKFLADYQAANKKFIDTVDQASAALKAGDNDGAAKIIAQMGHQEKDDHKQFRKPEDE